jgi:diketogulonate reductase-like aldo/keto reductase
LLEASGVEKIFIPTFAKGIKYILGNKETNYLDVYQEIKNKLENMKSSEETNRYTSELIDKINNEDLKNTGISDFDKSEIKKALNEIRKSNKEELNQFRNKIFEEIEKLKNEKK